MILIPIQPVFLLLLLNAVCLVEKQQISIFIVLGFTWLGLKPMIYGPEASTLINTPSMQFCSTDYSMYII